MNEDLILLGIGVLMLLVAWVPVAFRRVPMSLPTLCLVLGIAAGLTGFSPLGYAALFRSPVFLRFTELALVIALLAAGLRIDRRFGWRRWNTAWRLILIGMPLMALIMAAAGSLWHPQAIAPAIFLAGVLTPTDPVLASSVSVGPPGSGGEGEVRFGLSAEAGLNDGLAFPIVLLGLVLLTDGGAAGGASGLSWPDAAWFADQFLLRVAIAVVAGWAVGRGIGWLVFRHQGMALPGAASGLVAIGIALAAFALTELIGGYGFIAVFITALALRATCPGDPLHRAMTDFTEQIERILVMIVLFLFGTVASGLVSALSWRDAAIAGGLLLVARPASVLLAMAGSPLPWAGRLVIALFGIRGIATLFYLSLAAAALLPQHRETHALAALAVLLSIVIHGLAAHPVMGWLDRKRKRMIAAGRYPELQALAGSPFGAEPGRDHAARP